MNENWTHQNTTSEGNANPLSSGRLVNVYVGFGLPHLSHPNGSLQTHNPPLPLPLGPECAVRLRRVHARARYFAVYVRAHIAWSHLVTAF